MQMILFLPYIFFMHILNYWRHQQWSSDSFFCLLLLWSILHVLQEQFVAFNMFNFRLSPFICHSDIFTTLTAIQVTNLPVFSIYWQMCVRPSVRPSACSMTCFSIINLTHQSFLKLCIQFCTNICLSSCTPVSLIKDQRFRNRCVDFINLTL